MISSTKKSTKQKSRKTVSTAKKIKKPEDFFQDITESSPDFDSDLFDSGSDYEDLSYYKDVKRSMEMW